MKILLFSDIHSDLAALGALMDIEADHYFAVGDLVNWARGLDAAGSILARRAGRLSVIPGNHESETDIARLCETHGLNAMHGRVVEMGGFHVAALGYSNPTPFNTPGEYSEAEIAERLEPFAGLKPLILVCHCPPKATPLDQAGDGRHFGSRAIAEFLNAHQPEWFFCGHIHESAGVEAIIGATRGRNLGKQGYLLEI
jgi:Icc-related predicted phosphoesterase